MSELENVREQLEGAMGRQYDLVRAGENVKGYMDAGRAAVGRIVELLPGPIHNPELTEVPGLATHVKEQADLASQLGTQGLATAQYSESAFSGAIGTSTRPIAREIIAKAGLQVDALESIISAGDRVIDKVEALPGNASVDAVQAVDNVLIEGREAADALTVRAFELREDVNSWLQEAGMPPLSWPPGHG